MRPPLPCVLLLLVPVVASAAEVQVRGARWAELQPAEQVEPEVPGPWVAERQVLLVPQDGGLRVEATWQVDLVEAGWLDRIVIGPEARVVEATWNGAPAPADSTGEGLRLTARVDGPSELGLVAWVPDHAVRLLPAVRGTVEVRAPEREAEVTSPGGPVVRVGDPFATGAGDLEVALRERTPPADRGTLAVATVGIGLTVGEDALRGRARCIWRVRHGALESVALAVRGLGSDLAVQGPNVRSWRRTGDRIAIDLQEPATGRVDVELSWSRAVPEDTEASLPVPTVRPVDAFRTGWAVQMARDGAIEVVPELHGGEAVARSELPRWAEGLVQGTPTAAWQGSAAPSGELSLLRFVPVAGPAAVVDTAGYTLAITGEGRQLGVARLSLRNERKGFLRFEPPAGHRILGVQVEGEAVTPVQDEGSGWLIPLERSVETVMGPLPVTVEVVWLGEETAWERRERRFLVLPTLDAEVATARITVHLPPGYRSRLDPGDGDVVAEFTRGGGLTYGFASGSEEAVVADQLLDEALDAWLANDFQRAQQNLDEMRSLGAEGGGLDLLQSNVDLVLEGEAEGDDVVKRRVLGQAQARARGTERELAEVEEEAEEAYQAGRYAEAERLYERADDKAKTVQQIEQAESVEADRRRSSYRKRMEDIESERSRREEVAGKAKEPETTEEIHFGTVEVSGSLAGASGEAAGGEGAQVGHGKAAAPGVEAEPEDVIEDAPVATTDEPAYSRSPGLRLPSFKGLKKSRDETSAEDGLPAPQVLATRLSVSIPTVGEVVRYQKLLVEAGATPGVEVRANTTRRNP